MTGLTLKRLLLSPATLGIVVTPFMMALAAVSGGVGHGSYALGVVLFPFAAIATVILDHFFKASVAMAVIAAIQFPLYGITLTLASGKIRILYVATGLLTVHTFAVLIAIFVVYS
jgi:hypothetical protein